MTVERRNKQKLINDTIKLINKGRKEFGLPDIELLKGYQMQSTSCPIQKGLGVRCKVSGSTVFVRSKKAANRLARVWGTSTRPITTSLTNTKGYKDYSHEVTLPTTLMTFVRAFDSGALEELTHQSRTTFHKGVKRVEHSLRSDVKKVDHLVCSPETAKKIVTYF